MRCNHCDDSPCTDVCPVTALWEREDGIVDFDPERCIGCKACMQGCPYDALYIDPDSHTAAKCNYCSHRVDTGREPACVTVCPEDAILAGDLENPETEIAQTVAGEEIQARKPEKGTEPKLYYVDGDEGSITPGATAREDHYMWSDAPTKEEVRGAAREDFDLRRAAESLAESDVTLDGTAENSEATNPARTDGGPRDGCGCGGDCRCDGHDRQMASDGGHAVGGSRDASEGTRSKTEQAYELLNEEARRVYDVGEDHYASWGWEVYAYTWTKSIAAGAVLIPALLALFGLVEATPDVLGVGSVVGLAFLSLTGILLIADLERPARFHWVLLRPNWNSWLVKGAYIITAYGVFLGLVTAGWLAGISAITHPVVLGVGAFLAAATAVYTAFLFAQSKGRDLWQSPAMPLHMVVQAVIAGGAVMAVWGMLGSPALVAPAGLTLAAGLLTHATLVASELFTPHQTEDAEEAAARIVRGRFRTAFWAGGIGLGIVLPLVLLALGGGGAVAALAGLLALAGLIAYEYCWIIAPQTISLA